MKLLILTIFAILVLYTVSAQDAEVELSDDEIFDDFNSKFRVAYRRRVDFDKIKKYIGDKYRSIQEQNRRYSKGQESFNRTLYPFSYLSDEEFGKYYLGAADPDPEENLVYANITNDSRNGRAVDLPASFEWSENIVGKVKSQGQCGSCYAFAAIGVIKSRRAVKYGGKADDYDLSEQDAMECTRGCSGGWDYSVYRDYSIKYSGCAAYNYQKTHTYSGIAYACSSTPRPRVPNTKVLSYIYLQNNEQVIREYLYTHGPLYTRFNVYSNFYDYSKGIYSSISGKYVGGHAIMLVGWGEENGVKYWKLKNSWDSWWGENGFFRMKRGTNLSGIEASVSVVLDL